MSEIVLNIIFLHKFNITEIHTELNKLVPCLCKAYSKLVSFSVFDVLNKTSVQKSAFRKHTYENVFTSSPNPPAKTSLIQSLTIELGAETMCVLYVSLINNQILKYSVHTSLYPSLFLMQRNLK